MRTRPGCILVALLATAVVSPTLADDDARCGSSIVTVGMSRSDVLNACGQPDSTNDTQQDVRDGNSVVGTTTLSRWTYVSGAVKTVFTFDADKLVDIETD